MKFIVKNREHSAAIQKRLIELGYSWYVFGASVANTDKPYLFATEDMIWYRDHYDHDEDLASRCTVRTLDYLYDNPDPHITFADGTRVELSLESWEKLRK